jgi:hypothetical protein
MTERHAQEVNMRGRHSAVAIHIDEQPLKTTTELLAA